MSRIYSARLWVVASAGSGKSTAFVGTPGNVVVLRSIDVYWPVQRNVFPGGFELTDSTGAILFRQVRPYVRALTSYHWDGRQVLGPDNQLVMTTLENGWHWWVSGYDLTPTGVAVSR